MEKVVSVRFAQTGYVSYDKEYVFRTDLDLVNGDTVVCDTANGFAVAVVLGNYGDWKKATKWIVQKVDLTAHEERVAKADLLKELKKDIEKRAKEVNEFVLYEMLAKSDTKLAEMLTKYNELKGGNCNG